MRIPNQGQMVCLSACCLQFAARKAELRQKKAELDAQARFLESEGINTKEVEARIAFYDRETVREGVAAACKGVGTSALHHHCQTAAPSLTIPFSTKCQAL
jgi:hypothetical protein